MSFSAGRAAQSFRRGQLSRQPDRAALQPAKLPHKSSQAGSRVTGLLCCFLLGGLLSSHGYAEIVIEARVGFHGVFQLGRPFPLEVEINNSGRPAEGSLEVQVWKGGAAKGGVPYPLHYRRDLFVSGQSRRTIQLTVDPDFISRPLLISFISPAGSASRELDLRRYFSPAPVMLLVSEASSVSISLGSATPNRLVALSLNELPSDPRALLGVSHVIFYDQSLRELSRAQLLALESWLSAGGRMVVLGSLNYALYQEPSISRFLPVRVIGSQRISFVPQFTSGEKVAAAIPGVWAQASTLVEGKVLLESAGIPLLVETSRGKGRITYFAVDLGRPPLAGWDGLPKLLQNLLVVAVPDEVSPRTRWDDSIFSQIIVSPSFISSYVPTGSLLLAMLGYFAAIGVLGWLWQKNRLPPRNTAICLLIIVVVAAAAGYPLFSRGGNVPDGVLLSSTVLDSVADGYVEAQLNMAMFSTQIRQYNLQLARGWIDMMPVSAAKERPQEVVVLQDGGGSSRYRLPLREWDYKLFRVRFIDRFPLRADFEAQGDKLLMKINNQSSKDLVDCWLVLPGARHALGEIPRGSRWSKGFPLTPAPDGNQSSRADALNLRDLSFKDKTRDILFHSSFFPRDGDAARWSTGSAVFFGWVKDPERRVNVDDPRIHAHDYTLFRAIIPLAGPEDE